MYATAVLALSGSAFSTGGATTRPIHSRPPAAYPRSQAPPGRSGTSGNTLPLAGLYPTLKLGCFAEVEPVQEWSLVETYARLQIPSFKRLGEILQIGADDAGVETKVVRRSEQRTEAEIVTQGV